MGKKIIFEDIYTQGNPYHRDMKPQFAKGKVVSIGDILKQKQDYNMKPEDTFLPFPSNAIIQKMSIMYDDVYNLGELLIQLMNNKATKVSEKERKQFESELKNIKKSLSSITDTIDKII